MLEQECLLVKTASEIALKSPFVRRFFTKKLEQSIKFALKRHNIALNKIARGGGRLYLFCSDCKKAQKVLSTISGIHAIAIAQHFKPAEFEEIEKQVVSFAKRFLKKGNEFALDARAVGNNLSARDLERRIGAAVMEAIPGLKVRLKNPEKEIFIEVSKTDFFIYTEQAKGLGGLPSGVEGAIAMLFSGEEDELAAAFLLMHRGCNIFPIVKKNSKKLESHVAKLVPFNDYRQFALTLEKDLPALIEERRLKAIATVDSKLDEKSLAEYEKFNKSQNLVVLRPLLLYPLEKKKRLENMFY